HPPALRYGVRQGTATQGFLYIIKEAKNLTSSYVVWGGIPACSTTLRSRAGNRDTRIFVK
ncbi:MAG TPA: hypothetical protein PKL06_11460, partial [Chitinophagales bacterium]|nr:hypothetical protein [Chitinophagales bacterium]